MEIKKRIEELNDLEKIIKLNPNKIYLICEQKQILSDLYLIDKDRLIKNLIVSLQVV